MPNEYFTHEKSRVERGGGGTPRERCSYNRHPETQQEEENKWETEEDWKGALSNSKIAKKKEILSYKFLLASVDATRIPRYIIFFINVSTAIRRPLIQREEILFPLLLFLFFASRKQLDARIRNKESGDFRRFPRRFLPVIVQQRNSENRVKVEFLFFLLSIVARFDRESRPFFSLFFFTNYRSEWVTIVLRYSYAWIFDWFFPKIENYGIEFR